MTVPYSLIDRLGILPIIQAPMAGVSTPALAAGVSEAGALGSLGIGASTPDQAREMILATQGLTRRPFNVNVFCHAPARRHPEQEAAWLACLAPLFEEYGAAPPAQLAEIYPSFLSDPAQFAVLLETRPAVVSFHFGLPPVAQLLALQDAGIYTLATVTSLAEAQLAERSGIDAVVAQGIEAGGHRGIFAPDAPDEQLTTLALVHQLVSQTSLPVIAAGGIMNGDDIHRLLSAGAVATQLGSAFLLCPEAATTASWRANLQSPRAHHTRLTRVFSGRPARGMVNRMMDWGEIPDAPRPADYPLAYDAAKQLHALACRAGDHEFAAQWAGQRAFLAREYPAAQLIGQLMAELQQARQRA
ncbi:nitronate monooxygenase [Shimwellia pseudoproteus]|uniref:NAD(P)H-dependent flavin oxidoreductase n=1 Tax=Shimwellia pseudoproteus TaxID=570012 RepID=UPI0018EA8563|nr:nitronate monooxygenase [Shimwellia pseudoproteus]MBJ3815839.1 nitronate monooxygenase [Shimwellia pseudoproteus]